MSSPGPIIVLAQVKSRSSLHCLTDGVNSELFLLILDGAKLEHSDGEDPVEGEDLLLLQACHSKGFNWHIVRAVRVVPDLTKN